MGTEDYSLRPVAEDIRRRRIQCCVARILRTAERSLRRRRLCVVLLRNPRRFPWFARSRSSSVATGHANEHATEVDTVVVDLHAGRRHSQRIDSFGFRRIVETGRRSSSTSFCTLEVARDRSMLKTVNQFKSMDADGTCLPLTVAS